MFRCLIRVWAISCGRVRGWFCLNEHCVVHDKFSVGRWCFDLFLGEDLDWSCLLAGGCLTISLWKPCSEKEEVSIIYPSSLIAALAPCRTTNLLQNMYFNLQIFWSNCNISESLERYGHTQSLRSSKNKSKPKIPGVRTRADESLFPHYAAMILKDLSLSLRECWSYFEKLQKQINPFSVSRRLVAPLFSFKTSTPFCNFSVILQSLFVFC